MDTNSMLGSRRGLIVVARVDGRIVIRVEGGEGDVDGPELLTIRMDEERALELAHDIANAVLGE